MSASSQLHFNNQENKHKYGKLTALAGWFAITHVKGYNHSRTEREKESSKWEDSSVHEKIKNNITL